MKKVITILSLALLFSISTQAQDSNNSKEDLNKDMEQAMEQMQEMLKGFGSWMGDAPMIIDTTIIQNFDFPTEDLSQMLQAFPMEDFNNLMFQFSPDSLANNDMLKGMEDMMKGFSNQDFSGFEDLFKDLEKLMPAIPEGENGTKKKKRKSTTL